MSTDARALFPDVYTPEMGAIWDGALDTLREQGEDVDEMLRVAAENSEYWKRHPFNGEIPRDLPWSCDEV